MKFFTGSEILNELLDGGYSTGSITTIYGPAASGKTTCCLLAAIACAKNDKKIIFFDTENGFNIERLKQLTPDYKKVLEKVIILKANSFSDQKKKFKFLKEFFPNPKIGLIVVDTIGRHYRVDRTEDIKTINNELAEQMNILREIYKENNLVVLVTNQVYANINGETQDGVKIVGGEIIRSRSEDIIQLQLLHENKRKAILEKSEVSEERSSSDDAQKAKLSDKNKKEKIFEIKEKGLFEFIPL